MGTQPLGPPHSLVRPKTLAPLAAAAALILTIVQWSILAGNDAWLLVVLFAAPTMTVGTLASYIASSEKKKAWLTFAIGSIVHFFVVLLAAAAATRGSVGIEALVVALIVAFLTMALFMIITTPLLIASGHYADRKDLASGDGLLTFAGIWFVVFQTLMLMIARSDYTLWVPAIVVGLAFATLGIVRGGVRERWRKRVERGQVHGLRIRAWRKQDLDLELPRLDDAPHGDLAILERVEVGSLPYRSAIVGVPIALIRCVEQPAY